MADQNASSTEAVPEEALDIEQLDVVAGGSAPFVLGNTEALESDKP